MSARLVRVSVPIAGARSSRCARDKRPLHALCFTVGDMVCVPTWFNIVLIIIILRFYDILTLDSNSYGHLQVLISINLEDNHWAVPRVDFRRKQISIYDSMKEFRENKMYCQLLKPLQVIFPQWLEDVWFYDILPNLHSAEPWKLVSVDDVPQQQPVSSACGVFILMFTIYLMFKIQFNFDSWHGQYFRRKIIIDIFNGNIML